VTLPAFSTAKGISTATGPNNELIVVQGGVRGRRWTGDESKDFVPLGVDAPASAPTVIADPGAPAGYYIARIDVTKGGHCYNAPPAITINSTPAIGTVSGGVAASAISYLNQSSVAEIRVQKSGKYYPAPPTITLSDTCGTGAVLTAELDIPVGAGYDAANDPLTGITQWEIIQAPTYLDEAGEVSDPLIWYRAFNGTANISATNGTALTNPRPNNYQLPTGTNWDAGITCTATGASTASLVVSGDTRTGPAAKIKLTFAGARWVCSHSPAGGQSLNHWRGARQLLAVNPGKFGSGYDPNTTVVVRIRANTGGANSENDILIYGYPTGNDNNTQARGYPIKSITITNPGSGYTVAPVIRITSKSGFGAVATCEVANGQIVSVKLVNNGAGYKTPPTVEAVSGGAEAFPVARPHMRGKYLCYYRYIDDTTTAYGGPFPSNLSPAAVFDAGNGLSRIRWTLAFPDGLGRPKAVELWRSTSNQALTLYRVATYATSSAHYLDDLTDDELRDPTRAGYAAMPLLLPNGELCANRFTPPPQDKDVVVRFQDRYWYAVDTSGSELNTIYYSEVDEPESVPDINQIVLQQSGRDADRIMALAPLSGALMIFQERHAYALSFASNPVLDAQVHSVAFRGCMGPKCWDVYDGVVFALDQTGVYAITAEGSVEDISSPISNLLKSELDVLNSGRNFLTIDQTNRVVRAFVSFKSDRLVLDETDGHPTRVLCYSLGTKSWFMEKFPQKMRAATAGKLSLAQRAFAPCDVRNIYACESGLALVNEGPADLARGAITSVRLTSRGYGYKTPPTVTASGGVGAELQAVINDSGQVTAVVIRNPGRGYTSGSLAFSAPNDPTAVSPSSAVATFTATSTTTDTPTFIPYRMKTGCYAYVDDAADPKAAGVQPRQVRVAYKPLAVASPMAMRLYYNNAADPRRNLATRVRGAGFSFSTIDSSARVDLGANTISRGSDDGVASAQLSGRTIDDLNTTDRNVAVEIMGARTGGDPVIVYGIDVSGTGGR
jgi:hypothetical protein